MNARSTDATSRWERALTGVVFGDGKIAAIPALARESGASRVMLVTGSGSFDSSGASVIVPALQEDAEVLHWRDFSVNVDAADLARGVELADGFRPDLMIGVGGGTVMDMTKLVAAFGSVTSADGVLDAIRSGRTIVEREPRMLLAPTTSGSGSEATHFAVVYIGEEKFSVAGPAMRPDQVVLDPQLTLSASPRQKAVSGIDAVCQAIESLWAVGATEESRALAREALENLTPAIIPFVHEPTADSAHRMAAGSHLAGRAIDVSKTTAAHALSYAITQRHGVSHGSAVALTLGALIEAHAGASPSALQSAVDPAVHAGSMGDVLMALGAADGASGRASFDALLGELALPARLSEVGIKEGDLAHIASSVNVERLQNNPMAFSADGLVDVLKRSL